MKDRDERSRGMEIRTVDVFVKIKPTEPFRRRNRNRFLRQFIIQSRCLTMSVQEKETTRWMTSSYRRTEVSTANGIKEIGSGWFKQMLARYPSSLMSPQWWPRLSMTCCVLTLCVVRKRSASWSTDQSCAFLVPEWAVHDWTVHVLRWSPRGSIWNFLQPQVASGFSVINAWGST